MNEFIYFDEYEFDIHIHEIFWVYECYNVSPWVFIPENHIYTPENNLFRYNLTYLEMGSQIIESGSPQEVCIYSDTLILSREVVSSRKKSAELPFKTYSISFYTTEKINLGQPNENFLMFEKIKNIDTVKPLFLRAFDLFINKPPLHRLELKSITLQLLTIFMKKYIYIPGKNEIDDLMGKATQYIKECVYKENINISQLADKLHVSTEYFIRTFKKHFGMSPKKYINDMKLKMAAGLLVSTNRSIAEIAEQSGFGNIYYFSKIFKRTIGVTPTKFREINKI